VPIEDRMDGANRGAPKVGLARLVPLKLVGEHRQLQQQFLGGTVERPFAIFEVQEDADISGDQLLQRIRRLNRFAPRDA
jgi:hypothetical protein